MEYRRTQGQVMKNFFEVILAKGVNDSTREESFNEYLVEFINITLKKNPRFENVKAEIQDTQKENGKYEYKIIVDNVLEMSLDYEEFLKEENTPEKFTKCFEFFYDINKSILRAYKEDNFDNFVPTTKEDEITSYATYVKEKLLNDENKIIIDSSEEAVLLTLAQTSKAIKSLNISSLNSQKESVRDSIYRKAKELTEDNIKQSNKDLEDKQNDNVVLVLDNSGIPESIKVNKIDELVALNPELLNKYKPLRNEYNSDGSKKDIDELEALRVKLLNTIRKKTNLNPKNEELLENQVNSFIDMSQIDLILEKQSIENISDTRKLLGDKLLIDIIDRGISQRNTKLELSNENLNPSIKYFNDNIEDVFFELSEQASKDLNDLMDMIEERRNDERLKNAKDIEEMEQRILEKLRQELKEQPEQQQPVPEEEKNQIIQERDVKRKGVIERIKENAKNRKKEKEQQEQEEPTENEPELPDPKPYSVVEPVEEKERKKENKTKNQKNKSKTSQGEKGDEGEKGSNGRDGEGGTDGRDGENGVNGRDGTDGENGRDGTDGQDGRDGENGHNEKDEETNKKIDETNRQVDDLRDKIDNLNKTIDEMNSKPDLDRSILIGIEQLKSLYKQILEKNDKEETSRLEKMIEDLNNKIEEMKNKEVTVEDEPILPEENINEPIEEEEKEEDKPIDIDEMIKEKTETSVSQEDEPIILQENSEEQIVENTELEKKEDQPLEIENVTEEQVENTISEEDEPIILQENSEKQIVENTELEKEEDQPLEIENVTEEQVENTISEEDEPIILQEKEENKTTVNTPIDELRKSKEALIDGVRQKNEEELKEYEAGLQKRADEIIDKLDPSKITLEELYKARAHLDERIAQDVAVKRQQKEESLKTMEEIMEKYITRQELTEKLNELNKAKEELKTKQDLISSIENETAKSLQAVEDEIESVKDEIEKNTVAKEDGVIGTI